jgi:hypothetical protein
MIVCLDRYESLSVRSWLVFDQKLDKRHCARNRNV